MIVTEAVESGLMLRMRYSGHVGAEEVRRCLGQVRDLMADLKPGFLLLTDLSGLQSMDAACAPALGAMMDLCDAKGMGAVVRVIPDPSKDIGFTLLSRFHHNPRIKTQTYDNLTDALQGLSIRTAQAAPATTID